MRQILDLAMSCVQEPFRKTFSYDAFATEASRRAAPNAPLHGMCVLAQRLSRHVLRECAPNKLYAMRFVSSLQSQLSYAIMAAQCARHPPRRLRASPTVRPAMWGVRIDG